MKSSIKGLFVILAIVMSFVAVQAVWAGGPSCTTVVAGTVDEILVDEHTIVVGDDTVYGIPLPWVDIEINDQVVINAFVSLEGNIVACYLTINGTLIELRPFPVGPKYSGAKPWRRTTDGETDRCLSKGGVSRTFYRLTRLFLGLGPQEDPPPISIALSTTGGTFVGLRNELAMSMGKGIFLKVLASASSLSFSNCSGR